MKEKLKIGQQIVFVEDTKDRYGYRALNRKREVHHTKITKIHVNYFKVEGYDREIDRKELNHWSNYGNSFFTVGGYKAHKQKLKINTKINKIMDALGSDDLANEEARIDEVCKILGIKLQQFEEEQ